MYIIGIIKEHRNDEKRTPLVPEQIKYLSKKFSNLKIIVQPSNNRCFSDRDYFKNGAIINNDLNDCNLILGVKEILPSLLIPKKTYMFFSHTSKILKDNSAASQGTPGMDKKELLKSILEKKISLIDYENIRDNNTKRYLGFGNFAGIVGCYNSLNLYLQNLSKQNWPRAHEFNSYENLKNYLKKINKENFNNARFLVTGDGRVSKGCLELLNLLKIKKISPKEFLENDYSEAVYCNLVTSEYVKYNDKNFDLKHFINNPTKYKSIINKYMLKTDMLISAHYWDPNSPKLFNKNDIKNYKDLKVIGDITCDINGSIPTTNRSSTIENPYYFIDKLNFEEKNYNEINKDNKLSIMAVDNLPSELPRDSSKEFGSGLVQEVLPYLITKDDGRIKKATIAENGSFCKKYNYLTKYFQS